MGPKFENPCWVLNESECAVMGMFKETTSQKTASCFPCVPLLFLCLANRLHAMYSEPRMPVLRSSSTGTTPGPACGSGTQQPPQAVGPPVTSREVDLWVLDCLLGHGIPDLGNLLGSLGSAGCFACSRLSQASSVRP